MKCASSTSRRSRRSRRTSTRTSRCRAREIPAPAPGAGAGRARPPPPAAAGGAARRTPPHILVTTPESLYLLLDRRALARDAEEPRAWSSSTRSTRYCSRAAARTSRCRSSASTTSAAARCSASASRRRRSRSRKWRVLLGQGRLPIVDKGHKRHIDLAVEVPGSPLEAVMSHEVWKEIYDRLVSLIESHRTTLVIVNTRRLAERMAHQLSERLGADVVAAHHGSLVEGARLDAEQRLQDGKLKVLVATASLELGIDIGHVDLVCQISSPHRIATFLQRVGRSGHTVRACRRGAVSAHARRPHRVRGDGARGARRRARPGQRPEKPLDVLAQQIVAEGPPTRNGTKTRCSRSSRRVSVPESGHATSSTKSSRCSRAATPPGAAGGGAGSSRRREQKAARAKGLAPDGDHERRRDSRGVRLPRAARARRARSSAR